MKNIDTSRFFAPYTIIVFWGLRFYIPKIREII